LDLPQPLGPTMQVIPVPAKVIWVFSQKDLKPMSSTFLSLSNLPLGWSSLVPERSENKAITDSSSGGF
jgi:hypothetical protein